MRNCGTFCYKVLVTEKAISTVVTEWFRVSDIIYGIFMHNWITINLQCKGIKILLLPGEKLLCDSIVCLQQYKLVVEVLATCFEHEHNEICPSFNLSKDNVKGIQIVGSINIY